MAEPPSSEPYGLFAGPRGDLSAATVGATAGAAAVVRAAGAPGHSPFAYMPPDRVLAARASAAALAASVVRAGFAAASAAHSPAGYGRQWALSRGSSSCGDYSNYGVAAAAAVRAAAARTVMCAHKDIKEAKEAQEERQQEKEGREGEQEESDLEEPGDERAGKDEGEEGKAVEEAEENEEAEEAMEAMEVSQALAVGADEERRPPDDQNKVAGSGGEQREDEEGTGSAPYHSCLSVAVVEAGGEAAVTANAGPSHGFECEQASDAQEARVVSHHDMLATAEVRGEFLQPRTREKEGAEPSAPDDPLCAIAADAFRASGEEEPCRTDAPASPAQELPPEAPSCQPEDVWEVVVERTFINVVQKRKVLAHTVSAPGRLDAGGDDSGLCGAGDGDGHQGSGNRRRSRRRRGSSRRPSRQSRQAVPAHRAPVPLAQCEGEVAEEAARTC